MHRVVVDGEARDVDFDGNRVTVPGLRTDGRRSTVEMHGEAAYSRSGEGLHRFRDPVDGETYLYTQYEPADARRVFACFEQPDLKAPMTFVVTAPQEWHVLSNAVAEVVSPAVDGARTWRFAPTLPLAIKSTSRA